MHEPAIRTSLAVSSSVEVTSLALVVWCQLLLLAVEELAVLPSKASARGGVIPADTPRFRRRWALSGHVESPKKEGMCVCSKNETTSCERYRELLCARKRTRE